MAPTSTTPKLLKAVAVAALFASALFLAAEVQQAAAAEAGTGCIGNLVKCAPYLNGNTPSKQCCVAIKEMMEKEVPCLCGVLSNPKLLAPFNVTVEKALQIPLSCGLRADPSMCKAATTATAPPQAAPAPAPAAAAPGLEPTQSQEGSAAKIEGTALTPLFLTLVSIMIF